MKSGLFKVILLFLPIWAGCGSEPSRDRQQPLPGYVCTQGHYVDHCKRGKGKPHTDMGDAECLEWKCDQCLRGTESADAANCPLPLIQPWGSQ